MNEEKEYVVFGKDENGKLLKAYVFATSREDAINKANERYGNYFTFAKVRKSCNCGG